MGNERTLILDNKKVEQKISRIAYQIYENNADETEIIITGIDRRGYLLAEKIADKVTSISPLKVNLTKLVIDKDTPLEKEKELSVPQEQFANQSVILVDDVLNSGKTLIYAAGYLLLQPLRKMTTVVLVDRRHRKFPIKADFVGLTLATTLKEHIAVDFSEDKIRVFLE